MAPIGLGKIICSEQTHVKNADNYLRIEVIQKMISRFLIEKKMSEQRLAEALGISVSVLKHICSAKVSQPLIHKINLSLIKLYCKTRF